MKLSLVVPCYNEAENVAAFQDAAIQAFDGCGYDFEIIFVDDGSKDATLQLLEEAAKKDERIKYLSFSRNFGHQAAVSAGIDAGCDALIQIEYDMAIGVQHADTKGMNSHKPSPQNQK